MRKAVLIVMTDMDSTESENRKKVHLQKGLVKIVQTELTERQRQIFLAYHMQNLNISHIAQLLGVHKSTVSRTLKRAEQKIARFAKYL